MSTVRYAPAIAPLAPEIEPLTPEDATLSVISAASIGRMLEAEVFSNDYRVEHRDGRIYEKMAKTQAHTMTGNLVALELARVLPAGWSRGSENALTIHQGRIPLPGVVILRGGPRDYLHWLSLPVDVGLIAEISVTSLRFDTGTKMAGYSGAGIPVYWVLNPVDNVILVFEQPEPAGRRYRSARAYAVGQSVPLRLDGVLIAQIPAADLLPVPARKSPDRHHPGTWPSCPPPPPIRPRWKPAPRSSATPTPASRPRSPRSSSATTISSTAS